MAPNERITRCREAAGLSYEDIARRLGITRRQWWRMETDRIRILASEMPQIARALDTTISSLYAELTGGRRRRPAGQLSERRRASRSQAGARQ